MNRTLITLGITVLLLGVFTFISPRSASAQVSHQLVPAVTCSGNGCNGTDAYNTGCAAASDLDVNDKSIYSANNDLLGIVHLHWSQSCGTNWSVLEQFCNPNGLTTTIQRQAGSDGGSLTYSKSGSSCSVWSAQVYARNELAQACGTIHYGSTGLAKGCSTWD